MKFDQKGTAVFCVMRGRWGQWNVLAEGIEKRLASFDDRDDAIEFAQDLADTTDGSSVRIYADNGTECRMDRDSGGSQSRTWIGDS